MNFSRVAHLARVRDHNLFQAGVRADGWPIFGRVNPTVFNNFIVESSGNAFYHAAILGVRKRMRNNWSVDAHYTWSKAIDDVTDYGFDFAPHNQLDARAERGLSLFHQEHRFVASTVYQSPWDVSSVDTFAKKFFADWMAASIISANSSRPFNVITGFDNLGDGLPNTHRPLGLGRNAGIGPSFFTVDLRMARSFAFGSADSGRSLELILEAFNLLNRTNFEQVNNVVGQTPLERLPAPLKARRGAPTEPLSYASAHNPRQIQVGLRINF